MKRLFIITCLIIITFSVYSQNVTPLDTSVWFTNYTKAVTLSDESNLPLIMVFSGSDWCKPCIKLREQILVDTTFSEWAKENAICLNLDFPLQKKNQLSEDLKAQNDSLAEIYNQNGIFPLVLIFSVDGNLLGSKNYEDISVNEYISKLETIINNK